MVSIKIATEWQFWIILMHPPFSAPKNHPPNMVPDMSNSPTAFYSRDCSDLPWLARVPPFHLRSPPSSHAVPLKCWCGLSWAPGLSWPRASRCGWRVWPGVPSNSPTWWRALLRFGWTLVTNEAYFPWKERINAGWKKSTDRPHFLWILPRKSCVSRSPGGTECGIPPMGEAFPCCLASMITTGVCMWFVTMISVWKGETSRTFLVEPVELISQMDPNGS